MIEIQQANVTVMVTDMNTAIRFYTETLGFKLKSRYGDHWADIQGPGISIGLHPSEKSVGRSENLQIGLRVPDLNEAKQALEQNGVQFAKVTDDQVRLASFTDPDGNTLYLVQQD